MKTEHVVIYKEAGRYAGWPANYGIWAWGNEIVVGFTSGHHQADSEFHARDMTLPFVTMQARSLDGGVTWQTEQFPGLTPGNRGLSADEHMEPHLWVAQALDGPDAPSPIQEDVDFTHSDFALMCARTHLTAGTASWFYTSIDRCRSWQGPYSLPSLGLSGIAARTDYLVSGPKECLIFLTATGVETETGSRVFAARTMDGGKTFQFVSWIGPEIDNGYNIMPASVRLSDTHLLVATRDRREVDNQSPCWIDLYGSTDNGATWSYMNRPVADTGTGGNPPTLTRLHSGDLVITYGYRNAPFGIRAKLSTDNGLTWGEEIILRSNTGSHDIGYPCTIQRADGTLITVYYCNDHYGGPCYMAATLWTP